MGIEGTLERFESKGIWLHGFLVGKKGNRKAIIFVHGMTGNFYGFPLARELMAQAPNKGFDFFSVNTRGKEVVARFFGKAKKQVIGTALERFEECLFDIDGAVNHLEKKGYNRIFLMGHSTGCQKTAYYQGMKKDRRTSALVLLSPVDDYNACKRKTLGKRFREAVETAEKMKEEGKGEYFMPKWASAYSAERFLSFANPEKPEAKIFNYNGELEAFSKISVPILTVFGSRDRGIVTSLKDYRERLSAKTSSEKFCFKAIEGAGHDFGGKEKQTAGAIFSWLGKLE